MQPPLGIGFRNYVRKMKTDEMWPMALDKMTYSVKMPDLIEFLNEKSCVTKNLGCSYPLEEVSETMRER